MVRSTGCTSKKPGFDSQDSHGSSQLFVIPVPRDLTLSLTFVGTRHAHKQSEHLNTMQTRFLEKEVSNEKKRRGESWEVEDAICPSAESEGGVILAPSDSWSVGSRFPGFPVCS